MASSPTLDQFGRPLGSVRISVTDRCNLRCSYCMPEQDYEWLPREDILTFDEIERLVRAFVALGATRFRLTGGEPLLRRDLPTLVRQLANVAGIEDLAMTSNGVRLPELGADLRAAGLQRVTLSIDTLQPARFLELTGRDSFARAMAGIDLAASLAFRSVKWNTVVMRGCNDDEICDLIEAARARGAQPRFIEYMDVGGATRWEREKVVSRAEILAIVASRYGEVRPRAGRGAAPADEFELADGMVFGVIASTTVPFCAACDRARLTADGTLLTCLYARRGVDLRAALRAGADDLELQRLLARVWGARTDRGAEERLGLAEARRPLAEATELRVDPHLEMHTRGG